ncbi:MAG: CpsD/CapB family tyrosine-protein kinase [Gammaproteobacteria bacterium]|nr:CpsD/CapB family tyrosine-protein kinase [Gammaproteobacteria bacterium]
MERIQEALEKARRERQSQLDQQSNGEQKNGEQGKAADSAAREPVSDDAKTTPLHKDQANDTPKQSKAGSSIRISYSQTKTVSLDEAELKDRRIVAGFAHDERSEPYRQLRGQILNKFRENNWRTLAVTSPNAGSGRTLTAVNLAISLSLEVNQTVLLVDLDLRSPGVASCLGISEIDAGLVDYVRGNCDLKDILINPGYERLVVVPGTPQGAFTSEIITSPEMQAVTRELIDRYDSRLVIFDLPAVLDHDDALVFAPKCDATLMVLEEGGSTKQDVERAYNLLEGANIIGSVLNKVRYT